MSIYEYNEEQQRRFDRAEGRSEGYAEGIEKGIEKGRAEGIKLTRLESIKSVMAGLKYTPQQAMELLQIPEAEQKEYYSRL